MVLIEEALKVIVFVVLVQPRVPVMILLFAPLMLLLQPDTVG